MSLALDKLKEWLSYGGSRQTVRLGSRQKPIALPPAASPKFTTRITVPSSYKSSSTRVPIVKSLHMWKQSILRTMPTNSLTLPAIGQSGDNQRLLTIQDCLKDCRDPRELPITPIVRHGNFDLSRAID